MRQNYIWSPTTCSCKNGKCLSSFIDDSFITCDEIIDAEGRFYDKETKTILRNFNEKKLPVTHRISIFYLNFY